MSTALLLSGGMDSTALAFWLRPTVCVTVDYGQAPAEAEITSGRAVCDAIGLRHEVIRADCSAVGSGDLASRPPLAVAPVREWWPFRNQLLVTLAASRVIGTGVERIVIGTVKTDSAHADGTADFVRCMSDLLAMQEGGLRLEAPALRLTSAELIRESQVPSSILAWAHSCHVADVACGFCRGCGKHFSTLKELGAVAY